MKVVVNPGIIDPHTFLKEVIEERFPNPYMPDTPQRIATDTSQKVGIRFGNTIKSYMEREDLDPKTLKYIPFAIAGWCRYLLAIDDQGNTMELSADPMLAELQSYLTGIEFGNPKSYTGQLEPILKNKLIFGVDLFEAGVGKKIEDYFVEMIAGPGATRAALEKITK
jgi:fructuronate reductase